MSEKSILWEGQTLPMRMRNRLNILKICASMILNRTISMGGLGNTADVFLINPIFCWQ
jgi:hypothetical protein